MNFSEIKELLDAGFTPEQIMQIHAEPEKPVTVSETETKTTDPEIKTVSQPETITAAVTSEQFKELQNAITELTKTVQANAILNDLQPGQSVKTDMDILASVINPGSK